jgi:putative toxin-antitoxin system antitoxin component (TIGR02293 family)
MANKKKAPAQKDGLRQKDLREKWIASDRNAAYHNKTSIRDFKSGQFIDAIAYGEGRTTSIVKMEMSRQGITKRELEAVKELTALNYEKIAKVLSVTRATLINKKKDQKFNTPVSERIVGLADLYAYGIKVFGDSESFNEWMNYSNRALGGKTPLEMIDNQYGREEVKHVIGRIEYGVYS